MPRLAAIDIGSNAVRLRIVEVDEPGRAAPVMIANAGTVWREVVSHRAAVRLGREVFLTGALASSAISSAVDTMRMFRKIMDDEKVDHYRAVATSAVREAENGHLLVERAHREAGIEIEVIEGVEEARLVQLAVSRRLRFGDKKAVLIDIGGGSTELTLMEQEEPRFSQSLPVGTVRLLEAFLEADVAVDARHAELVREFVDRVFVELSSEITQSQPDVLVATGGNCETLASLCPRANTDAPTIDVSSMQKLVRELSAMSSRERIEAYGLRPDRADTIVPAALILLNIARRFDHASVIAPGVGLKEGVLEDLIDRHINRRTSHEENAVIQACLRLGRRYHFDEKHGLLVSKFATRLFDDTAERHGLFSRDRLLLQAAAVLHDVGDFIRYEGHHKHSWYLLEHSEIMGLSHAERSVVANLARYHRKSFPDPTHPNFRDLSREDRARVRGLSAILRLADALDREHRGKISSVRGSIGSAGLTLSVEGDGDWELEEWTVARKAGLFRAVYDLDVEVVATGSSSPRARSLRSGRPLISPEDD
ncbi:MAG: Ppx/GppA phosphatase family protein [Polyangiaceae bacterium]